MCSTSAPGAFPARSLTEVNAAIRAFMTARAGRPLGPEEQAEYEQLLAAWSAAVARTPDAPRTERPASAPLTP
ncbi:hypothetical protein OG422_29975 [Streptomyces sp. NBC_01525]